MDQTNTNETMTNDNDTENPMTTKITTTPATTRSDLDRDVDRSPALATVAFTGTFGGDCSLPGDVLEQLEAVEGVLVEHDEEWTRVYANVQTPLPGILLEEMEITRYNLVDAEALAARYPGSFLPSAEERTSRKVGDSVKAIEEMTTELYFQNELVDTGESMGFRDWFRIVEVRQTAHGPQYGVVIDCRGAAEALAAGEKIEPRNWLEPRHIVDITSDEEMAYARVSLNTAEPILEAMEAENVFYGPPEKAHATGALHDTFRFLHAEGGRVAADAFEQFVRRNVLSRWATRRAGPSPA
jgi:hypothetical protein